MGYYINTGQPHGKAEAIAKQYNGTVLSHAPAKYSDIPEGKALIVVVDNGPFEAAGFCYDEREFKDFTRESDWRPRQYIYISRADAEVASGYKK